MPPESDFDTLNWVRLMTSCNRATLELVAQRKRTDGVGTAAAAEIISIGLKAIGDE